MKAEHELKIFSPSDLEPVEFNNNINSRIKIRPMYFELGFSSSPQIFGRRVVLDGLVNALNFLPNEYGFLIWDIYRPRQVQEKLFNWMREEIRKKNPTLSDQENYEETRKYMSPPSKIGEAYCPPHLSGGAVDLTLFEISNGNEVDMGTPFDDCTEQAHSHYFDSKPGLTPEEQKIKTHRDILRDCMKKGGMVSYQYEWWHFDIGNIFWSRVTGQPAAFGPLFGDREWKE